LSSPQWPPKPSHLSSPGALPSSRPPTWLQVWLESMKSTPIWAKALVGGRW
jgi:hypothetical protein